MVIALRLNPMKQKQLKQQTLHPNKRVRNDRKINFRLFKSDSWITTSKVVRRNKSGYRCPHVRLSYR